MITSLHLQTKLNRKNDVSSVRRPQACVGNQGSMCTGGGGLLAKVFYQNNKKGGYYS